MSRSGLSAGWIPLAATWLILPQEGGPGGGPGLDPLPAEPPVSGPVWGIVVPAALFLVALVSTVLLYRHFAGDGE